MSHWTYGVLNPTNHIVVVIIVIIVIIVMLVQEAVVVKAIASDYASASSVAHHRIEALRVVPQSRHSNECRLHDCRNPIIKSMCSSLKGLYILEAIKVNTLLEAIEVKKPPFP